MTRNANTESENKNKTPQEEIPRDLVEKWGSGPEKDPYDAADLARLEELYAAFAEDRPDRSRQTELSLRKLSRLTLEQERCFAAGSWDGMKNLQTLIKAEQDAEAARRKEAARQDMVRVDDIVAAVERAGLHLMDYEELCAELANRALHKSYPYTRDAADRMLLLIRNATAWNEGVPEIAALPPELRMTDPLREFAPQPDALEQQLMKEL